MCQDYSISALKNNKHRRVSKTFTFRENYQENNPDFNISKGGGNMHKTDAIKTTRHRFGKLRFLWLKRRRLEMAQYPVEPEQRQGILDGGAKHCNPVRTSKHDRRLPAARLRRSLPQTRSWSAWNRNASTPAVHGSRSQEHRRNENDRRK